jgi:hypothetical protein
MSNSNLKAYALSISVKPTSTRGSKYNAVSFKGIAIAKNPNVAKELGINMVLDSYIHFDGSSINRPLITRENLTVKECKPYADFITQSKQ